MAELTSVHQCIKAWKWLKTSSKILVVHCLLADEVCETNIWGRCRQDTSQIEVVRRKSSLSSSSLHCCASEPKPRSIVHWMCAALGEGHVCLQLVAIVRYELLDCYFEVCWKLALYVGKVINCIKFAIPKDTSQKNIHCTVPSCHLIQSWIWCIACCWSTFESSSLSCFIHTEIPISHLCFLWHYDLLGCDVYAMSGMNMWTCNCSLLFIIQVAKTTCIDYHK